MKKKFILLTGIIVLLFNISIVLAQDENYGEEITLVKNDMDESDNEIFDENNFENKEKDNNLETEVNTKNRSFAIGLVSNDKAHFLYIQNVGQFSSVADDFYNMFVIYKNYKLEANVYHEYDPHKDYENYDYAYYFYNLSYFGEKFSLFSSYEYYKGYNYDPVGYGDYPNENHYTSTDLTNRIYTISAFVQNNEGFSMKQLYYNNELQKKSEGSLVLGLKYIYARISGLDSLVIPSMDINGDPTYSKAKTIKHHTIAPGISYKHNLVVKNKFHIGGSCSLYYGVSYNEISMKEITNFNHRYFESSFLISIGYIGDRFFIESDTTLNYKIFDVETTDSENFDPNKDYEASKGYTIPNLALNLKCGVKF